VNAGSVAVTDGDLVAGDDTGIVVVPRARLAAVLELADRIVAVDAEVEKRIRAGESFADAAAAAGYLPPKNGAMT
jgi:regulator of RNase E activity RraA